MANQTLGLEAQLYNYLLAVSLREIEVLAQLRQATAASQPMSQMQIAPEQGQFMALLVQLIGAQKTLDIGVFTGYSALVVALALPQGGKVVACEVNQEYAEFARHWWLKAGLIDKIDLHLAPVPQLPRLPLQNLSLLPLREKLQCWH
jgi:predicted O-methyltransferase YrrM